MQSTAMVFLKEKSSRILGKRFHDHCRGLFYYLFYGYSASLLLVLGLQTKFFNMHKYRGRNIALTYHPR